ncbi:MAG: S24 family peptidase [Sulfurospirillaceae bacterium]|nr:S24 family peptidase [Sulfurospirillaceae bacterium]
MELGRVIDNLKDVLSYELGNKRVYDKDVAQALGISKESLSHLKKRNSVPYEAIVYFCAKRSLSINWILFDQVPKSLEEKTEKFARIKYFKELHTSAGGGAWNDEEGFEYMYIDYEGLNTLSHLKEEYLHAINVIGDSMEPTLRDKEIVVCDVTCKEIIDGNIYIINTPNSGLLIKRLTCRDEKLSIMSDNPQYLDEVVNICHENIHVLGRVLGTLAEA